MLYKIYYQLKNGEVEFFTIFSNDIDTDKKLIDKQVELRQGEYLSYEKAYGIK